MLRCFRLRNDLYCVEWGVKFCSLTRSDARKVTVGLASHWPCVTDFMVLTVETTVITGSMIVVLTLKTIYMYTKMCVSEELKLNKMRKTCYVAIANLYSTSIITHPPNAPKYQRRGNVMGRYGSCLAGGVELVGQTIHFALIIFLNCIL